MEGRINGNGRGTDAESEARRYWDESAATFDEEPDHGLGDPQVLAAWTKLLQGWLPADRTTVLDVGCGTGSLSRVLAGLGHEVTGIDFSAAMIERAEAKVAGLANRPRFMVMDAAAPELPPASFGVIVCRHVLWALAGPERVLARWLRLLRPGGRLIMIEGYWSTGAGLHSEEVVAALPHNVAQVAVLDLTDQTALWGKSVSDERYAVIVDRN